MTNAPEPSRRRKKPPADQPWACPVDPGLADTVGDRPVDSLAECTPQRPWGLSVQHYPALGICAVIVEGELDLETAPLLEQRVREQLLASPAHLVLDLEPLHFLDSSGLNCLLRARQLAQTSGVQLHLAGMVTPTVVRALKITGLLGVFHTYPSLIHAVVELTNHPDAGSQHVVPPPVLTAFWRCLVGSVWVLELCKFDGDPGLGPVVDWINSGVPATHPAPDTAHELLAAHGLWLFPDPDTASPTGGRHRIGYACADTELIMTAHLVLDEAAQTGLHPMLLAIWVVAGYSTKTAAGWIRAGCLLPH